MLSPGVKGVRLLGHVSSPHTRSSDTGTTGTKQGRRALLLTIPLSLPFPFRVPCSLFTAFPGSPVLPPLPPPILKLDVLHSEVDHEGHGGGQRSSMDLGKTKGNRPRTESMDHEVFCVTHQDQVRCNPIMCETNTNGSVCVLGFTCGVWLGLLYETRGPD